jgi:hypothetical protein
MKLQVGSPVVVKSDVVDPDLGFDIAGWQGRVLEIDYGGTALIRWDSITLRKMSMELLIQCENENLDWEFMTLDMIDLERATARDSEADALRTANQLKAEMIGDPRLNAEE